MEIGLLSCHLISSVRKRIGPEGFSALSEVYWRIFRIEMIDLRIFLLMSLGGKENVLPPVTVQGTLSPVTVDDSSLSLCTSPFCQPQHKLLVT